jgi:hypothetical protein
MFFTFCLPFWLENLAEETTAYFFPLVNSLENFWKGQFSMN